MMRAAAWPVLMTIGSVICVPVREEKRFYDCLPCPSPLWSAKHNVGDRASK
eukprot:CAMPEP_0174728022 /NCGR_PEP_ID=MMETSP1094-20130205/50912_1 /TAXON_ID=156173 /ORGANISM="Chrysochromulina brevifilum, Strain UTEX LB 985" /LENGTH=50 /DNA_ID=CAMNT_0015929873 /DNA_START=130 /DNA_END=282 /DNA_ORIENTATION=-